METAIYGRVSTEEQAMEGYSIRGQVEKLKSYVSAKSWSIYDVYLDEGISGKNMTERPAITRMMEDIKAGHVKNVLVFKLDRLTRSVADLVYLIDLFKNSDCAFNSLSESIDTSTASGRMFIKIIGIFAEFERENISERIILGRERKVKEGYTLCSHTASYGYDRPKGQKIQSINEEEALIVREIFDSYANKGINITEIARRLNLRGVPTKHGGKWTTNGTRNILKNNNYTGDVRHHYQDEVRAYTAKGQHEPIIPQEIFDKAQHLLTKNPRISPRKQPKEENYFAGFLECAQCGYKLHPHNMYIKLKDGTQKFLGNYGCGNTIVDECNASEMSALKLEKAFCEYIAQIADFEEDNTIQIFEQEQKNQKSQQQIEAHKERLRQLETKAREALDNYVDNIFSVEEYRTIKKRIDSDKQSISDELKHLQIETEEIADNKLEIAKSFRDNWSGFSNVEKRMFLMRFVDKIVVENEKIGEGLHQKRVKISDIVFKELQLNKPSPLPNGTPTKNEKVAVRAKFNEVRVR